MPIFDIEQNGSTYQPTVVSLAVNHVGGREWLRISQASSLFDASIITGRALSEASRSWSAVHAMDAWFKEFVKDNAGSLDELARS